MAGKSPLFRLEHILESIALIREYCADLDFDGFQRNRLVRQAVERNLEIISEASRHVPAQQRTAHPEIPWRRIADIGNVLRHQYHEVDPRTIWDITRRDLDTLERAVRSAIQDLTRGAKKS